MAEVTGNVFDAGLEPMILDMPEVRFRLNAPATSGFDTYSAEKVIVAEYAQWGAFVANLAPTTTMNQPDRWYSMEIVTLGGVEAGGTRIDFPDWKIFVPPEGGKLPDLIRGYSINPYMIFFQSTAPDPWPVGGVWINTITGDANRKDS